MITAIIYLVVGVLFMTVSKVHFNAVLRSFKCSHPEDPKNAAEYRRKKPYTL
jgi:hypothetical protein